jgi:hypothetical protein
MIRYEYKEEFIPNRKEPIHNVKLNLETLKMRPAKRIYTVWIVPCEDDSWKIYHCPDCRTPIAQYKGDLVAEIPGESPEPYPVMIQCKNSACGRKIVFEDSVHQLLDE